MAGDTADTAGDTAGDTARNAAGNAAGNTARNAARSAARVAASDTASPAAPRGAGTGHGYTVRVVIAVALVVLAYYAMQLLPVLLLVFGSVVVAAALRGASAPLHRRAAFLSERAALAFVIVAAIAALLLLGWFTGDRVAGEIADLRHAFGRAVAAVRSRLAPYAEGASLWGWVESAIGSIQWGRVAGLAGGALSALGTAVLMLVLGIYLAASPASYRRGFVRLVPPRHRERIDAALLAAGDGLALWLRGQLVAMLAIGVLTGIGLAMIGMKLAPLLAVIAGLLEFVPFFGTAVATLLIVLLAFAEGPQQAWAAALVCLAIQGLESYVLQPWIQRRVVALPPALGMLGVVAAGVLFGPLGAVFATPLVVAARTLVLRLYVEDVLESGSGAAGAATSRRR
ncbi:MAG: AI-2E family transporter [Rubrivivax sp.]|nr:AI-2E family transporter [Rubrivivax sp.]